MSNEIRIIRFFTKQKKGPEPVFEDWVEFRPPVIDGNAPGITNIYRVRHLDPANIKMVDGVESSERINHLRAIWSIIGPAYAAWKEGREIPLNGTPLAAWPGVDEAEAEVLRMSGVRTVEELRDLTQNALGKIKLPDLMEKQKLAKSFLDSRDKSIMAAREQELLDRISTLEDMVRGNTTEPDEGNGGASPSDADEKTVLQEELDRREVAYDKRWGADRLRQVLEETEEVAA